MAERQSIAGESETGPQTLPSWVAIALTALMLALLGMLHILSPELDPSWRMVSEYANGQHGIVLSIFFLAWAAGTWALALAMWPRAKTLRLKLGVVFLVLAGIGEAMAALFDINHPLHGASALIGMPSVLIAALLLGAVYLAPDDPRRPVVRLAAHMPWLAAVVMSVAVGIFFTTFAQAGGDLSSGQPPTVLPAGTIALAGWANRLLIVVYGLWAMLIAWTLLGRTSRM